MEMGLIAHLVRQQVELTQTGMRRIVFQSHLRRLVFVPITTEHIVQDINAPKLICGQEDRSIGGKVAIILSAILMVLGLLVQTILLLLVLVQGTVITLLVLMVSNELSSHTYCTH